MDAQATAPTAAAQQATSRPSPTVSDVRATIASGAPFLFPREVEAYLRVSETTIWRQERLGKFPRRVHLAPKRIAWRTPEIVAFAAGTWSPA